MPKFITEFDKLYLSLYQQNSKSEFLKTRGTCEAVMVINYVTVLINFTVILNLKITMIIDKTIK